VIHGVHHEDPQDASRLVMPPFNSVIMGTLLYLGFRVLLGPAWVDPFFGSFIFGYLCYDYIHFSVHYFTPRTPIGRYLKQTHMIHHYAMPNARWGVSSPLWDWVFGTLEEREPAQAPKASVSRSSSDQ
jgi:sterol desaturase/sphingolipid hydroxylase (fatty acid hydroxylase superfamily)